MLACYACAEVARGLLARRDGLSISRLDDNSVDSGEGKTLDGEYRVRACDAALVVAHARMAFEPLHQTNEAFTHRRSER